MRLGEVFRFEVEHRFRSASTWAYGGILAFLTFWIFLATADGTGTVNDDTPVRLAGLTVIVGMLGMSVTAALFGDAAVRDTDAGMDPLLFTSRLRKSEYLGGRFLAALVVNAVLLAAVPLSQVGASLLLRHFYPDASRPLRAGAYVQPYLLFSLPNVVLIGAILFTIAALARQVIPAYLGAIGIFIGYLMVLNFGHRIEDPTLSTLIDPMGISALQTLTRYWTPVEQNTRLVGFPGVLVGNRVIWLGIAAAVLALLHRRFRFAHVEGGGRGRRRTAPNAVLPPTTERARPVEVPRVAGTFGFRTAVRQTLAVAHDALGELAGNRWFAVMLLGCTGIALLMGWNVSETVFDTSTWPLTFLVAGTVLSWRVRFIVYLLIILCTGELVWKKREVGVAEIADATPTPEGALMVGRFLALVAAIVMILSALMVGGILIQALQGYRHFELGLYLRLLFGLDLADYVLLAALAMTIHVIVNHKYLGHIVVLMAFLYPLTVPQVELVRHHLLLYGTDPGWTTDPPWTFSDMNGFGPFIGAFMWFKLYWAAWALLLGVVAVGFQVRGRESGGRYRLRQLRARITGPVARTAGVAVALILALGGFIFYNTNVLNAYLTPDEARAPRAEYEKRYARFAGTPQPTIDDVALRVEIHPDEAAVDLRGTYRLVNRTDEAIDSVHVFLVPQVQGRSISFDRASDAVLVDDEVGYRIYALARPVEPGDSLHLTFDVSVRQPGFPNRGIQTDVVGNGSYFDRRWLPVVGYQPALELAGDPVRARLGLAPQAPRPSPDDAEARRYRYELRDVDRAHIDVVVGTAADQIALAPGVLRESWTEGGRRYFHYETERPTSFSGTVISARYAVLDDRWNDIALRIFHHPTHTYDLDRMMRGMKASLAYYTDQFGPYPDSVLRIAEVPPYGVHGRAHPNMIAFSEDAFLSRVREGEIDQAFFGTAHEVAHQWWGGQVRSASNVRGAAFLSESLANYSAMMVLEKAYGPEVARRVYDYQMERYLRGRASQSHEVPLLDVESQSYISYRKGAVALYTLRERIGEERVNTALRRYLEKYRDAGPPYPTSRELYAELRAAAPDSLQGLLTDLFETVTLWDVGTERAVVRQTDGGAYEVTLKVRARKVRADSVGTETEVPMDDLVEVGVFAPGEGDGLGEPLHLERHRIHSGEQTITVTVPREPARAGIDPYNALIDRQRNDNVVEVDRDAGGAEAPPAHPVS